MVTSFIETQFPISRLSAEAYKERKANNSQTLTKLGKWWGRKPLILVRAAILGMLMPASNDPKKDREIFLKILTMDDDGVWLRKNKGKNLTRSEFDSLPYTERLKSCDRPENVKGPSEEAWGEINKHLETNASSLGELVEQLGCKNFGRIPKVGDSFCGGGSIPFEAARIGCDSFGSDLNPVACLLTWASLNIIGGGSEAQIEVSKIQDQILAELNKKITEIGIEHNEQGERADAFLYCVEVKPEGCDYFIPLAPSWVIGEKSKVVVTWEKIENSEQLFPNVQYVSDNVLKEFKAGRGATAVSGRIIDPFDPERSWSGEALRGPAGLRLWEKHEVVPRPGDVFQERLYCIRWLDGEGNKRYATPTQDDILREEKVLTLLLENLNDWQENGYIPSQKIPTNGDKTDEPIRTRGWTYWHHLFTPRQLLTHGLISKISNEIATSPTSRAACLLGLGRLANWDARLCRWLSDKANEKGSDVFTNQALNPLVTYSTRPVIKWDTVWPVVKESVNAGFNGQYTVCVSDARDLSQSCDIWITDPPYADAVNYHELADFFLCWYDRHLKEVFPDWSTDPRSELAVRGAGDDFRRSMVDVYKNLSLNTPDNGIQMVMFTHQNPAVWADLGMILWAAGLKVTAAWTVSTETESAGIKKGNYVQGTVCLVLRKRLSSEPGFLDEVYPLVEDEVKQQISSMQVLDEGGEPNFNDADYQLAAYAAALKVLTHYGNLDGRDVEYEVFATRSKNTKSDFQIVIERALQIACDTLIPDGLEEVWRDLTLVERYYLRSLDIESRGERRKGMYEELARGFGVSDIKPLLKSDKANGARMLTASGFASSLLAAIEGMPSDLEALVSTNSARVNQASMHPFSVTYLRHLIFAVSETVKSDFNPEQGLQYLKDTLGQLYWTKRTDFMVVLDWLNAIGDAEGMGEWKADSEAARILAGRLRNDHA